MNAEKAEGVPSKLARTTMMVLAVTLHNIPEGMAVGIVYVQANAYDDYISFSGIIISTLSYCEVLSQVWKHYAVKLMSQAEVRRELRVR